MKAESQQPGQREDAILALNAAIKALNLAEKTSTITPAKTVFGSISLLLTMIRDSMASKPDYIELGLFCADVCQALDRGIIGKRPDELAGSVYDAIAQLTLTVADIRGKLVKWGEQNVLSRLLHAKNDKKTIATWRLDLEKVLRAFNKELAMNRDATSSATRHNVADTHTIVSGLRNEVANTRIIVSDSQSDGSKSPGDTCDQDRASHAVAPGEPLPSLPRIAHATVSDTRRDVVRAARAIVSELEHNVTSTQTMVSDMHRTMVKGQGESDSKDLSAQTRTSGESPPPAPKVCFGRNKLVEEIVGLAESLTSTALIGAGGIGKTSIALTVLHHDHIEQRFGHNRRFVRCDQFPSTLGHFLRRLSKVIGAGVENPEDMTLLRPFLSSSEMFIVLDNAESILDPRGTNARDIYAAVEELSQFKTVCLCVTSRITTVPRHCKRPAIPTLSMEAASEIFYDIYGSGGRSSVVDDLLRQLDFHALSTTLLATTASHNMWDHDRLAQEWDAHRTEVLQTDYDESLAATIELSLASPTFRELGPDARDLLGVIAFFPQGVDEDNIHWLFPTVGERRRILDKLCALSLTHRSDGFITMLAPLRDYLCPKDPNLSPLLCTAKDRYFRRLSVNVYPGEPGFEEAEWITLEDVNVEHLLDVFTSVDANSAHVWAVCVFFMQHLFWYKRRPVVLGSKIEGLPDDHHSKPKCLLGLSLLFLSVGNPKEGQRLHIWASKLRQDRGDVTQVTQTWGFPTVGKESMSLQQAEEELEVCERLGDTAKQARCLIQLAWLLCDDGQLDAAEEATFRIVDLLPEKGDQLLVWEYHYTLSTIYQSGGKTGKAIHHLEVALGIASSLDQRDPLFANHYVLAKLFLGESRFDDAQAHIEQAKSHTAYSPYYLGLAMELQTRIWHRQDRFEEARSEALRAAGTFERLGAANCLEDCRNLLQQIQEKLDSPDASG